MRLDPTTGRISPAASIISYYRRFATIYGGFLGFQRLQAVSADYGRLEEIRFCLAARLNSIYPLSVFAYHVSRRIVKPSKLFALAHAVWEPLTCFFVDGAVFKSKQGMNKSEMAVNQTAWQAIRSGIRCIGFDLLRFTPKIRHFQASV